MARSFFGLQENDDNSIVAFAKNVIDEVYFLVRKGNLTYTEVQSMPIEIRHYWIEKVQKENDNQPPPESKEKKPLSQTPWDGKSVK